MVNVEHKIFAWNEPEVSELNYISHNLQPMWCRREEPCTELYGVCTVVGGVPLHPLQCVVASGGNDQLSFVTMHETLRMLVEW